MGALALSKEGKKLHEQINYPLSPVKLQVFLKLSVKEPATGAILL